MEGWLDLVSFSEKYSVSQSTLRRRIRARSIPFKLDKGKYLLEDTSEILSAAPLYSRGHSMAPAATSTPASPSVQVAPRMTLAPKAPVAMPATLTVKAAAFPADSLLRVDDLPDPVHDFLSSDELLPITFRSEYERLKIENRLLRKEMAELQTLVKALEAEVL